MKTLGLDLSLIGTGIVLLQDGKIKNQKLIKSKPEGKLPLDELKRLIKIITEIKEIVLKEKPDLVIIEGMAFLARNTVALVQLSALNYMTRQVLYLENIPFIIVAPTTLKKFVTGSGNAKKDVMLMEVYKKWKFTSPDSNIADAFGLAKIGENLNSTDKLTKQQLEVIKLLKKQL